MRVFVATSRGQGARANDFSWTVEGELVEHGTQCSVGDVDDACGCRRSMAGLSSSKATTTFTVADIDIEVGDYEQAIFDSLIRRWGEDVDRDEARELAADLAQEASRFGVGVVLERRDEVIQVRAN